MSDIPREIVEKFVNDVENGEHYNHPVSGVASYKALKASLKPSKQEVVEDLKVILDGTNKTSEFKRKTFQHAIDYLTEINE
jgi:hypothetical protein